MGDIPHQIDLIPGLVFPNKLTSIMSTKEHEELKTQVDDLLDQGLVLESESSYLVPTALVHEKDGYLRMCFDCQVFNNFFIHEEVRFNIRKKAKQYEKQANEGYHRLVFDHGRWIWLHMRKEVLIQRCSKLCTRVDGPSMIIKKIEDNAYKLELLDDYDILPIFNVKDFRSYHGEGLRASLFSQLWGIDAGASTTFIENSILIIENSDLGGCEILDTPNMFLNTSILILVTILI